MTEHGLALQRAFDAARDFIALIEEPKKTTRQYRAYTEYLERLDELDEAILKEESMK